MRRASPGFIVGVAASLLAAAIIASMQYVRRAVAGTAEIPTLHGWLGDIHHPSVDLDLIDLVLSYEQHEVRIDLKLGNELADELEKVPLTSPRTYSLALADLDVSTILMDLDLIVEHDDDFFFGVASPGTGVLRGTFRVAGCVQTGTGWFRCELHALSSENVGQRE